MHKGFYYVREKSMRKKVYWRCTQYTTNYKCHGRLHTEGNRVVHKILHNHNSEGGERQRVGKTKSNIPKYEIMPL